jgi:hypothetical protein
LHREINALGLYVRDDDGFGAQVLAHGSAKEADCTSAEYQDCAGRREVGAARAVDGDAEGLENCAKVLGNIWWESDALVMLVVIEGRTLKGDVKPYL